MRDGCILCVLKHLAQASVLMDEAVMGYPHHKYLAIGHLAEAEAESYKAYPDFAKEIRKVRLLIMNENRNPIIEKLIMDFLKIIGECVEMERKNSKKFVKGYF